jgi:exosortase
MNAESPSTNHSTRLTLLVALPVLALSLLWASWPALGEMSDRWSHDARYSHGFLVPAFAAFLLWFRRGILGAAPLEGSAWGLVLVAIGALLKLAGARYYITWVEAVSILPSLAGLALLIGGWRALRWAGPSIGFLFFMIPMPYRLEVALGSPLQRIATLASTYGLQTLGLPAVSEGNIILLDDVRIGVVDACNGLGMLFMFLAFAVGVALVIRNVLLDKVLIVLSAIPIALGANVLRITLTGLLHETAGSKVADAVYHDLAGWLMMPMAIAALYFELFLLSRLLVQQAPARPMPLTAVVPGMRIAPPRRGRRRGRGGVGPVQS